MLAYDLKVGYSCNNKCKHCVIDDSKDKLVKRRVSIDLSTEECIRQIDMLAGTGVDTIVLTGGEVSIRKDFPILIDSCLKRGFSLTIQTNGRRLSHSSICDAVKFVEPIRFVVALHGKRAATHDAITQVKGSFDETCSGIKAMCNLGKLVVLKVVISKINIEELSEIVMLADSLGVKYICFAFPHGQGAARKNFEDVIPQYSILSPILKELIKKARHYHVQVEFEAIPFCIVPFAMQTVGELKYFRGDTLCTQVKEETFQWSNVRKNIKRKAEQCAVCDMDVFCEGVWMEYIEVFGVKEFRPIHFPSEEKKEIIRKIRQNTISLIRD